MLRIDKVKRYSVLTRKSKVRAQDFARPPLARVSFVSFYDSLPDILKARDLRSIVDNVCRARRNKRAVIFMSGAHVIKCGLSPVVIELIRRKVITAIVLNGAGVIHDFEIALQGKTSEDVAESLKDGSFGMGRETADFINQAVKEGLAQGQGFGNSVARKISQARLRYKNLSVLAQADKYKVPVSVAVAIGTDIIHQHPSFDGAATGEASARDFRLLAELVAGLNKGGVVLHFGSAVLLPEVFLKALNLSRNLGSTVKDFTTANFDMLSQYRVSQNVVMRPVATGGQGYSITGHHEIMLPLLAQAIIEQMGK